MTSKLNRYEGPKKVLQDLMINNNIENHVYNDINTLRRMGTLRHLIDEDLAKIKNMKFPGDLGRITGSLRSKVEENINKDDNEIKSGDEIVDKLINTYKKKLQELLEIRGKDDEMYICFHSFIYLTTLPFLPLYLMSLTEKIEEEDWRVYLILFRYGINYTYGNLMYTHLIHNKIKKIIDGISDERTKTNVVVYSPRATITTTSLLRSNRVEYIVSYDRIRDNRDRAIANELVFLARYENIVVERMRPEIVGDQRVYIPNTSIPMSGILGGIESVVLLIEDWYVDSDPLLNDPRALDILSNNMKPGKKPYDELKKLIKNSSHAIKILLIFPTDFIDIVKELIDGSSFEYEKLFETDQEYDPNTSIYILNNVTPGIGVITSEKEYKKIKEYFKEVIFGEYIPGIVSDKIQKIIFSDDNEKTWVRSFTHASYTPDTRLNYESLELVGDSALGSAFINHLFNIHPNITNNQLNDLKRYYLSKEKQAELSDMMNLPSIGRTFIGGVDYKEDIQESMIGALVITGNRAGNGIGAYIIGSLVSHMYTKLQPIDLEKADKGAKTRVTELLNSIGGKIFELEGEDKDRKTLDVTISPDSIKRVTNNVGFTERVIGIGSGLTKEEAQNDAYEKASKFLQQKGVNAIEKEIRENKRILSTRDHPELVRILSIILNEEGYGRYFFKEYTDQKQKYIALIGVKGELKLETTLAIAEGTNINTRIQAVKNYIYCKQR